MSVLARQFQALKWFGSIDAGSWINAGLAFLYPEICQTCGQARATPESGYVCERCRREVRFIGPPFCERCGLPFEGEIGMPFECSNCRDLEFSFRYARSAVVAKGLLLEVIHRYKYQRALWFEPFLADLLARQAEPVLGGGHWDLMIPVPLHPAKQREREFNQAERLAHQLGRATQIPVNARLLRRVEFTRTQTLLSRTERAANVRRAFALRASAELTGQRIVLVDDVFTTGSTTDACARILRQAGAEEVCVWTVARGL